MPHATPSCASPSEQDSLMRLITNACPSLATGKIYVVGTLSDGNCAPQLFDLNAALSTLSQGSPGTNGTNGWTPILSIEADGARRVVRLIGYTGGTGSPPVVPADNYVGPSGLTNLAGATDIRGAAGSNGFNGWSPRLILVQNDGTNEGAGERYSLKFDAWLGGGGSAPASPSAPNLYLGPGGFGALSAAFDLRGPAGSSADPAWVDFTLTTPGITQMSYNGTNVLPQLTGASGTLKRRLFANTLQLYAEDLFIQTTLASGLTATPGQVNRIVATINLGDIFNVSARTREFPFTGNFDNNSGVESQYRLFYGVAELTMNPNGVNDILVLSWDMPFASAPSLAQWRHRISATIAL